MLKEWLYQYNSFNSLKVLAWREQLEAMSRGEFPVPVMAMVDPTNLCNVNCSWCKWKDLRRANPTAMPDRLLVELPDSLASWGVRAVQLTGGGEPMMHPKISEFLTKAHQAGLLVGLQTNGLAIESEAKRKAVLTACRWIGVSLDAASQETYMHLKRPSVTNAFNRIIDNVTWLCRNRSGQRRPQVAMKFVVHHLNYGELFQFVELAKSIGADEVHFRPIWVPGYRYTPGVMKTVEYGLREARKAFEDAKFRVFGIVHKFDRYWARAVRFKRCLATPISGVFMADGTYALCADRRDDKVLNLGRFSPFEEFVARWGSHGHKDMIEKIAPTSCPKCSQCITNEIIEKVIIDDEMTLPFV